MSEKVFISPSLFKDNFSGYRLLDLFSSFSILRIFHSTHSLLTFFLLKNAMEFLSLFLYRVAIYFSLSSVKMFSLSLVFLKFEYVLTQCSFHFDFLPACFSEILGSSLVSVINLGESLSIITLFLFVPVSLYSLVFQLCTCCNVCHYPTAFGCSPLLFTFCITLWEVCLFLFSTSLIPFLLC